MSDTAAPGGVLRFTKASMVVTDVGFPPLFPIPGMVALVRMAPPRA
ncbi:hypothetical protein [Kitasatospora sp. NPDC058218]